MKYKATYQPSRETATIPNQALTVKDILERFTRGQGLPIMHESHDDPQGLSEDEHMQLYEVEDEFERRDVLISIEEDGAFNEPPKQSSSSRRVKQAQTADSELVERSIDFDVKEPSDSSKQSEN